MNDDQFSIEGKEGNNSGIANASKSQKSLLSRQEPSSYTVSLLIHIEENTSDAAAAAAANSLQSCPTLCNPIDGSPPGSPVPGILQANAGVGCHFLLQRMKVKSESEVAQLCPTLVTPWTAAYQAPPSMGFSRQKYWSRVPLPSPEKHLMLPQIILNVKGRKQPWGESKRR